MCEVLSLSGRGARNFFIRDLNTWEVEVFFWYLEFYTFPPALRFCRLLIGVTELTGVKIVEIPSLSCRCARNFFIRDLNTWEVEVFFGISSSIHFLLRCASAGSSFVLQSSLVSKFLRFDH